MNRSHGTRRKHKHSRSCRGKVRYRDHTEAVRALHRLETRSERETIPVRAYECHRCGGWHTTSQEAR